jgi:Arc/MetJ family transcription regulator
MRTTVDIPEELLEEARKAAQSRTVRETVLAGLEELIRKARRDELRKMAGSGALDLDLPKARKKSAR